MQSSRMHRCVALLLCAAIVALAHVPAADAVRFRVRERLHQQQPAPAPTPNTTAPVVTPAAQLPAPHVLVNKDSTDDTAFSKVEPTRPVPIIRKRGKPAASNTGFPPVLKAKGDRRQYRRFVMPNGLDVLLVNDRRTARAAASMDVGVGSNNDPPNLQGLAHFCEHMMFMGSKSYPKWNAFEAYVPGAWENAYTSADNTNYYFDLYARSLRQGLRIFADVFTNPLFSIKAIGKEINAVNAEHHKGEKSDPRRYWQLLKHLTNDDHPNHKGPYVSLKRLPPVQLRQAVKRFYRANYRTENMRLAVVGPHSLDLLERMVRRYFANLPKRPHEEPFIPDPFPIIDNHENMFTQVRNGTQRAAIVHYMPIRFSRQLSVVFSLPPQTREYRYKSIQMIEATISHEGPHSLQSVLKRMGLGTYVDAFHDSHVGFDLIRIHVSLTANGVKRRNVRKIVSLIMEFLRIIQAQGIQRWRWRELGTIAAIRFRLKPKEPSRRLASQAARDMRFFDPEHVIAGRQLYFEFDPQRVSNLLAQMTPERMTVLVGYKLNNTGLNRVEPFYGTPFRVELANDRDIAAWNTARWRDPSEPILPPPTPPTTPNTTEVQDKRLQLKLPRRNTFIPKTIEMKENIGMFKAAAFPVIIKDVVDHNSSSQGSVRIWYKQDTLHRSPMAVLLVKFWSNAVYATPRDTVMAMLYVRLVQERVDALMYPAEQVGYKWGLRLTNDGLELHVSGYDDGIGDVVAILARHLQLLLEKGVPAIPAGFVPEEEMFSVWKEDTVERFQNAMKYSFATDYAKHALLSLLQTPFWQTHELLNAVSSISLEDVVRWSHGFFQDTAIEALVHGNVYRNEAFDLVDDITDNLYFRSSTQAKRTITAQVERVGRVHGSFIFWKHLPNRNDRNSAVIQYYQSSYGWFPEDKYLEDVLSEMVGAMLYQPAFHQLRSVEQLGYIVAAGRVQHSGVNGLYVICQSARRSSWYIDARIRRFLMKFRNHVAKLPVGKFRGMLRGMFMRRLGFPATVHAEAAWYWSEISTQRYEFFRRFRELGALRRVNKKRLLQYVDRVFGFRQVPNMLSVRVQTQVKLNNTHAQMAQPIINPEVAATAVPLSADAAPPAGSAPPADPKAAAPVPASKAKSAGSAAPMSKAANARHTTLHRLAESRLDAYDKVALPMQLPRSWHMPELENSDPSGMLALLEVAPRANTPAPRSRMAKPKDNQSPGNPIASPPAPVSTPVPTGAASPASATANTTSDKVQIITIYETVKKNTTIHIPWEFPCAADGRPRFHYPVRISIESVRTYKAGLCVWPKQRVGPVLLPPFAIVKGYDDEDLESLEQQA